MKSMHCKLGTLEAGKDTKLVKPRAKRKRKPASPQELHTVRLTGIVISFEPRDFFDGPPPATGAEVVQDTNIQDQPGIPDAEGEASTDSIPTGSSDQDALWLFGPSHSVPPGRKKVEGINPFADGLHLDSTRDGNFVATWDLELKVGLLETQDIITRAGFQKCRRLLTKATYIAYEPASSDMGNQAHEIHSIKLWGQPYSYDSPGWIYRVDRISLVLSSTFHSGS